MPLTIWRKPQPLKKITRYFLLSQTYTSTIKTYTGDGTTRAIRDRLNLEMDYSKWSVVELVDESKLKYIKLFHKKRKGKR